jgi:alkanesulfonate monooxygenase SsuD/methylene tetrahydromethanopterin reductase-like flavin-dependent oxidoreductase (luciferase family)
MRTGLFYGWELAEERRAVDVYGEVLEQVELADDLGFDSVLFGESHFAISSGCASLVGTLGALAGSTRAIRVGTGVKVLPLDNPARIAEDYAVLDLQLNGRLILGVGPGEQEAQFRSFGVPFAERWERFVETLDFVTKAWTNDAFCYGGRYFCFPKDIASDAAQPFRAEPYTKSFLLPWERGGKEVRYLSIVPKPVQIPHPPVWLDTNAPEAVRFAARKGYAILPGPQLWRSAVVQQYKDFAAALKEAGRDLSEVERPLIREVYVAEDRDKAIREAREHLGNLYEHYYRDGTLAHSKGSETASSGCGFARLLEERAIVGDPDQVFDQIKLYQQEGGINHIVCRMNFPGLDHSKVLRNIRLFAAEVITRLRS